MQSEIVDTPAGDARITWHLPKKATASKKTAAGLVLAVSHGAGGGIEARDLQALAATLPALGVTVALVEQPWRVAGKKLAPAPKTLDTGWRALWPALARPGLPVVAGGRSAGARVACRTARELGAHAVLALSFPLHPPVGLRGPAPTNCSRPGYRRWSSRAATTPSGSPQNSRRTRSRAAVTSCLRCRTPTTPSPSPSGPPSPRTRPSPSLRTASGSGSGHSRPVDGACTRTRE